MQQCDIDKWFGRELIVNCKAGNDKVCDPQAIQEFLDELVETIHMEKHGEALITHFGEGDLAGYTLVQLIKTSSIVFHFVDSTKNFYGNIFSCKTFDVEAVRKVILKHFQPKCNQELTLERGI